MRTVSITVPSKSRCRGPVGLMGSVAAGVRRPFEVEAMGAWRAWGRRLRCARWLPLTGRPGVSRRRANNGIGDLVHIRGRGPGRVTCRDGCRASPTRVSFAERLLAHGPAAQDDVSRKQTLVFATFPLFHQWIRLTRRAIILALRRGQNRPRRMGIG